MEHGVKMLELLLLRHAKSRWDEPGAGDHERDLAPRGVKAAERMGRLLVEMGIVPDRAICSTALRAARTWELAAAATGMSLPTLFDDRLYLAAPERMLAVAGERGGDARRLLLVGHDPGIHRLAARLAVAGDEAELAALAAKFPTGALAHLELPVAAWSELADQRGRLLGFWTPRRLEAAG